MDPIKNMISATDPVHNDPSVPDGEAALRRMLAESGEFSDRLPRNVVSLADRKHRRARLGGVLTLAAAAVTAGVLVATNLGALTTDPEPASTVAPTAVASPTASATASASVTPSPTPTATSAPAVWTTFTDTTGQATFELPASWTVSQAPQSIDGGAYNTVVVKNSTGKTMSTLSLVYDGTGGPVCADPKPFSTLDSVIVDIPQKAQKLKEMPRGPSGFVFRIVQGDKIYGSMALNDAELAPGTTTCGLYNSILGPDNMPFAHFGDTMWLKPDGEEAALAFDSVAEATAYMQTQDYQDTKRMLISLALHPVNVAAAGRFVSKDGSVSFELPAGWTAKDEPAGTPDFPATGVGVFDESSKRVARLYYGLGGGLGGGCGPEKYTATELDSAPSSLSSDWAVAAQVRFSYRVLDQTSVGKGFSYQVGLVDKSSGQLMNSCLMYSVVSGAPRGSLTFADRDSKSLDEPVFQSMAEAKAYMGTPEYTKLKSMIRSLKLPAQG
ncbi:hypothetical protein SRABI26_00673 [Arthrobacter sp. Bi26]|nr:hypothetical protein SRABI26_00673 [Arthrobacter sp. Bi26]